MRYKGFTLAEVLIALGVIGVVAAITLPRLISDIKEKQYEAGRQKALSIIGEAGKRIAVNGEMNSSYNANQFIENTLKRYVKITKTCPSGKFQQCGWADKIKAMNGTEYNWSSMPTQANQTLGTQSYTLGGYIGNTNYIRAFTTSDGYSFIMFYYPNCANGPKQYSSVNFNRRQPQACIHTLYDMNGKRNPNQFGKDIGVVTVFWPDETVMALAPRLDDKDSGILNYQGAVNYCNSRGKNYYVPSLYERYSLSFVEKLASFSTSYYYWTSTKYDNLQNYIIDAGHGIEFVRNKNSASEIVRCAKPIK